MPSDYLNYFHNQKDSDFDPSTGGINNPVSKKHLNYEALKESEKIDKEIGNSFQLEKQIEEIIKLIDDIELDTAFQNDKEQMELLKKTKGEAIEKIREVLKCIENYMIAIHRLDTVRIAMDKYDQKTYKQRHEDAENDRVMKHKLLFDAVRSAIRFISHSFGEISEEAIEKWEEERTKWMLPILHITRVKLPEKVICPENVDLVDRKKNIYHWAVQLAHSLGKLKNGLT